MATPVYTPRVNNNDDAVRLSHIHVQPGACVKAGDALVDVETDKATFGVEAEAEGYVLNRGEPGGHDRSWHGPDLDGDQAGRSDPKGDKRKWSVNLYDSRSAQHEGSSAVVAIWTNSQPGPGEC